MLRDETSERVDDRAIADLLVKVGVRLIPLVRVDLEEGLHQELWPQLHKIARPRQNWHLTEIARDAIIDLNQTLLAHKSKFDPVFTAWAHNGHVVLLWVDALPDELI